MADLLHWDLEGHDAEPVSDKEVDQILLQVLGQNEKNTGTKTDTARCKAQAATITTNPQAKPANHDATLQTKTTTPKQAAQLETAPDRLKRRLRQYQVAAVSAKRNGNMARALEFLRQAKAFEQRMDDMLQEFPPPEEQEVT